MKRPELNFINGDKGGKTHKGKVLKIVRDCLDRPRNNKLETSAQVGTLLCPEASLAGPVSSGDSTDRLGWGWKRLQQKFVTGGKETHKCAC